MRERSRRSTISRSEDERKARLAVQGVSANLRRLLKDVSLHDLAETLHQPVEHARDLWAGTVSNIGIDELILIARKYDLSLEEFFDGLRERGL